MLTSVQLLFWCDEDFFVVTSCCVPGLSPWAKPAVGRTNLFSTWSERIVFSVGWGNTCFWCSNGSLAVTINENTNILINIFFYFLFVPIFQKCDEKINIILLWLVTPYIPLEDPSWSPDICLSTTTLDVKTLHHISLFSFSLRHTRLIKNVNSHLWGCTRAQQRFEQHAIIRILTILTC